jgi:ActR/RegA family two-component response regulator
MSLSLAPLEGVVGIVVDVQESARRIEKAFTQAGAAVFMADDDQDCRGILKKIQPHFAVIDPAVSDGSGPQSLAWMLFSHPECRTIVYSSNVHAPSHVETRWLISKDGPISDVIDAVLGP